MAQIPIIGSEGKPILFAYLDGENLKFEFEYYGRDADEGDYEFIHTVAPEDFESLATKFGLELTGGILATVRQISDLGQGQALKKALTDKEIKNDLWTWLS